MPREIWTSPVLGMNRARLIGRCTELIASGQSDRFLYITASQPLLNLVTDALLDGKVNRGVWGTLPVFLFRGFVHRVLETAIEEQTGLPLESRTEIDREDSPVGRSLLSLLIKRLAAEGKLTALAPLAHREGGINSIARLIGEIQRAAKTPREFEGIVEARRFDQHPASSDPGNVPLQRDYDRDLALVYDAYVKTLDRFQLTESDADQLRALEVLRGELGGKPVRIPWIERVGLLVLDGFFDFTPVQGEMLRQLIPRVPDVLVNLNLDPGNPPIFEPFKQTINQLKGIAEFDEIHSNEASEVAPDLRPLRSRLFNPGAPRSPEPQGVSELEGQSEPNPAARAITVLECGDRDTEIRRIAKEIKRLVGQQGYLLNEIALVVRRRESYDRVISRIFNEEVIPCALERGRPLAEAPVVRAALKLFELLLEWVGDESRQPRMSSVASVIKSEYFEPPAEDLQELLGRYQQNYLSTLGRADGGDGSHSRMQSSGIGCWNPDAIENVIAYVGSELRIDAWLHRARRLTSRLSAAPARELVVSELAADTDSESQELSFNQTGQREQPGEKAEPGRRRPSRELDPLEIGWATILIEHLAKLVGAVPRAGAPRELSDALMRLLDRLQFAKQVTAIAEEPVSSELVRVGLELRGLEGIRRAMSAAIRAFEVCWQGTNGEPPRIGLGGFLEEVMRAIRLPSLRMSVGEADGLKVLEATNMRGLQFRVVFIVGLIEGGFPLRTSSDWLYPHEERERLRQYGLALEDISSETLLKEEHYFYQAACRATERLYLSRPLLLEDESETVAAYYIGELRQAISPAALCIEEVRRDLEGEDLLQSSTRRELAISLVRQEERLRHRSQRTTLLDEAGARELLRRARRDGLISELAYSKIEIERERASAASGRHGGLILDRALLELIQSIYSVSHVFSASELSIYGKCPFQFFSNKVLKLEPRGEAALDLTALDTGTLLHKILNRFFTGHRGQSFASIEGEELAALRNELQKVADDVFDEHEQLMPPLNPQVWQIDREIRKVLLDQLLLYEVGAQRKTAAKDLRPVLFELAFGMKSEGADPASTDSYLVRERPGSEDRISIRGQIDRVDQSADRTLIAYDYKLTRGATRADMEDGRDLQLHIYLSALEQLFFPEHEIAGGGYYSIRAREKRRNQGLYREALKAYTGLSERIESNLEDAEWLRLRSEMENRIWEFVASIRAGRFEVKPTAPKKTCTYCSYSGMCRFNRLQMTAISEADERARG